MDSTIINVTGDKTVHFIHADSPLAPYVEYEFYDENGSAYEEGKEVETNFYLQVDIFSKGSYTKLEAAIKNKLLNAGFDRGMAADLYENETQLYHKAMRFIFSINNSEGDG
ncbi:prohead protease [Clostridium felsineum]|nr:prohead protease [Clostridium felsineum]